MTKKLIEIIGVDRTLLMIFRVINKSNGQREGPSRRSWRKSRGRKNTMISWKAREKNFQEARPTFKKHKQALAGNLMSLIFPLNIFDSAKPYGKGSE